MLRRAPPRVFSGTRWRSRCQSAARLGDGAADAVHLAQFAGGDLEQGDEVVGLPEAVDVALAEADAAAQRPAPGGGVVDRDGGAEIGAGRAEAAFARAFDDVDAAVADPVENGADADPGERVPHGETSPFRMFFNGGHDCLYGA